MREGAWHCVDGCPQRGWGSGLRVLTLVRACAFAWEPAQHMLGASGPSLLRSCVGLVLGNLRPNRFVSEMSQVGGQPSGMGTHFIADVSFALFAHFLNLPVLDFTPGNVLCGV